MFIGVQVYIERITRCCTRTNFTLRSKFSGEHSARKKGKALSINELTERMGNEALRTIQLCRDRLVELELN